MGFLLLYDLTNEASFLEVRNWIDQLKTHSLSSDPDIVLCGHKSDLQEKRLVNPNRAREFAKNYQLPYLETSAKTGHNIDRAIEILLDKIMYRQSRSLDSIKIMKEVSKFERAVNELRDAVPPPSPKKKRRPDNVNHSVTRKEHFDVKNEPRSGQPVMDKVNAILEKVEQDWHISFYDIAEELGIDTLNSFDPFEKS
ncbi:Ras-related protein Rab-27A [Eumeta japonica]|uniref:Ras-related protein Rab-27A n=1 Tax=Eumeta variegata TaxID=151549 RepID=A0A4C1V9N4_EUMVA|nr:Ras-related protein Rab-27A [Eumeta japonica]